MIKTKKELLKKPAEKKRSSTLKPKVEKPKKKTAARKAAVTKEILKPGISVSKAAKAVRPKKEKAPKVDRPQVKRAAEDVVKNVVIPPPTASTGVAPAQPVNAPVIPKPVETKKFAPPPLPQEPVSAVKKEEPKPAAVPPSTPALKEIELELPITLKDLAVRLAQKPSALIKLLMDNRIMIGINQALDENATRLVCEKFGFAIIKAPGAEELALRVHDQADDPACLKPRAPVVTFMGHVDHGKTSLLDAIRKTKVAEREHGGITQHIGAYRVTLEHGEITFLDTPGHEAFTAMRARGARITDIVVLVVAADDGIMPQTREAIDHARAAGVSIIVALNKIDKPQANVERVKKQLAELQLLPEDWGGKTITVGVSAKTGEGIDNLLEMILLEAQMLELKADPGRLAKGVVVEAKLSKGKGPVVTLLVQNGSLYLNQTILVGMSYGRIRAMFDDRGRAVTSVLPSNPVEILGLSSVPLAGESFFTIADEKQARDLAAARQESERQQDMKAFKRISLEDLHAQIVEGKIKELKLILKADMQGSLEAIKETLSKIDISEVKLDIIHDGIGNINSSDVVLAVASNALILGFHVEADERARELMSKEGIEARTYNIIYELANDIKAAVEGLLEPKLKKIFIGRCDVRKVFKLTKSGIVAGCYVTKGKFTRNNMVTVMRNGEPVFEGKIAALKRFKDDVREVLEGFECGISLGGYDDVKEGDVIEAHDIEKIARKL